MFEITVKDAIKVPARNWLHITGNAKGNASIGDVISDGLESYEIVGIPMLHSASYDGADICIVTDDSPSTFLGKVLVKVSA